MKVPYRKIYQWQDPEIIAQELMREWGEEGFIWLDGDNSQLGRYVTLAMDPIEQICCRGLPKDKNSSNPFQALRNLNFGHWTGWLTYEAAAWIEPQNPWKDNAMAILWLASHDPIFKFDLLTQELWIEGFNKKRFKKVNCWFQRLSLSNKNKCDRALKSSFCNPKIPLDSWQWHTHKDDYAKNVSVKKEWIQKGDLFQANLTTGCTTHLPKNYCALDLFCKLRKSSPAPFSGVVIGGNSAKGEAIISASPERFLKVLTNGEIETRPIKGTRPRNQELRKDADMAIDLVSSTKDRAENIMIVDLLRNDLGRVCQPGSISVPQLVGLETYPQVHHLTSVIKGNLESKKTWVDLLESCWPGGSITGAPKLRACKRLDALETTPRGPYCGSLIKIDWNGDFDSNIVIRSLIMKDKMLSANAGCGIVADSNPDLEAEEMHWKLLPMLNALT